MRRRYMTWGLVSVVLVIGLFVFTPLTPGNGGRACGPELLDLYRFVEDDLVVWQPGYGWDRLPMGGACRTHDHCYAHALLPQAECDRSFLAQLNTLCDTAHGAISRVYCDTVSRSFYGLVRVFGWAAYDRF